ncbi:MAG: ATP-binding cassette domain-containing protein [Bacteroidota bacterium]
MSIYVENLTKSYNEQLAVDNISFAISPGEIIGFLGPNGAGKSTTMKILTGYLAPDQGEVSLGNLSVVDHPQETRKMIGYLPEHNPLYPGMYIQEFLNFVCHIHGIKGKEKNNRIKEVIQLTGLDREQHKKIKQLSKGYRQRVGLAQAIIHDPSVLILDEPTTGLDPNQLIEIRKLILKLGKEKTVIFSSHLLSEVEAVAQRVLILHKGRLQADETLEHLHSQNHREHIFHLELNKEGFDPTSLSQHPNVISIEPIDSRRWEIRVRDAGEVREELFQACVDQGFVIFGLEQQSLSLEYIFAQLTQ